MVSGVDFGRNAEEIYYLIMNGEGALCLPG